MTTAFVLSGGGSLGAVQVGMLSALLEREILPDLLVGTSAGAINAVYAAGRRVTRESLADLGTVWQRIRRRDVFGLGPGRLLGAMTGRQEALCSPAGLGRILATALPFATLEETPIPVHVLATDALSGQAHLISTGDAMTALLASCAIPGVFPSVRRDGQWLCDGALADRSGIAHAVELGADRVYLLPGGTACARTSPPRSPAAAAMHAVTLLLEQRALSDVVTYEQVVDLRVLPPLCPLEVSPMDFHHADSLMSRAEAASRDWLRTRLDRTCSQAKFLGLHRHSSPGVENAHGRNPKLVSKAGVETRLTQQ